jgi:phosphoglycolate phosphatase
MSRPFYRWVALPQAKWDHKPFRQISGGVRGEREVFVRTVIFDLDGTLADTSADLISAANACFRSMGAGDLLDPVADALTAFHGGRAMLRLGFSRMGAWTEAEVDAHYPVLLDAYEAGIDRETVLYPGAIEAVGALKRAGFAVGICTNKPERLAEILVTRLGVRDLFGSLVGADTLPVRKPDPAPYRLSVERAGGRVERSILIGDTETDRKTGLAAGVPVALVTFGPEGQGVARLSPEALLDHYDELPALAERLLPVA